MPEVKVRSVNGHLGLDLGLDEGDHRLKMFYTGQALLIDRDVVIASPVVDCIEIPYEQLQKIYGEYDKQLTGKQKCWSCHHITPAPEGSNDRYCLCSPCERGESVAAPLPEQPDWAKAPVQIGRTGGGLVPLGEFLGNIGLSAKRMHVGELSEEVIGHATV